MAENMLGKSFVRLDAILKGAESSDTDIVRAARVSTGRHLDDVTDEKLKGMVNFLYRDHHLTPFQKIVFRFHVKASIRAARKFFCVLFSSHNEFSGRYSVFPENDFYAPSSYHSEIQRIIRSSQNRAYESYRSLLEAGVAKEQARLALPYSFFTQFYWTVDLRTLFEFFDAADNHPLSDENFQFLISRLKTIVAEQAPVAYETYLRWSAQDRAGQYDWAAALKSRVPPSDKRGEKENIIGGFVGLREISGEVGMIVKCLSDRFSPNRALDQLIVHWDLEVPIFVWRQLVRHRKGYPAETGDDFEGALERRRLYIPAIFRSQKGKVGHYEFEIFSGEENLRVWRILNDSQEKSIEEAKRLLRENTINQGDEALLLPYAFYTRVSWVLPLSSLINVFLLRLDSHTQWETGQYVRAMYRLFKTKEPLLAEMIENHFWPKFWRNKPFPDTRKF